jgi:uncharacterized lipoprotein YddW (UPF0748 family)
MVRKWLSCLGVLGVVAAVGWGSLWGCAERRFGENQGSDVATIARSSTPDLGPLGYRDGVWLTFVGSDVFQSRQSLGQALQQIRDAGFNTVYPVVWNKGCTTFPSETMGRLTGQPICPAFAGRDPLKEILEENERLGLRLAVIPWFEYGLKVVFGRALDPKAPNPNQLASRFELAFKAREQGMLLKRQDGSDAYFDSGNDHFFGFLNPVDLRVVDMLSALVREVTHGYPVHGFQIDDHFSMEQEFGYNDDVISLFHEDLNRRGRGHIAFGKAGLSQAEQAERERAWKKFRADLVADVAIQLGSQLPKRQGFVYQISPGGDIGWSVGKWLQEWTKLTQAKNPVVQEFVIQVYRHDLAGFNQLLMQNSITLSANKVVPAVGIFAGGPPGQKYKDTKVIVEQIRAARKRRFDQLPHSKLGMGVNIFYHELLFNGDPARVAAIRQALLTP